VQNIAHGAQPDHKQAKVGLRVQTLIFSQGRVNWSPLQPVFQPLDGLILMLDHDAQPGGFEWQGVR
jgi:hypothetical protein